MDLSLSQTSKITWMGKRISPYYTTEKVFDSQVLTDYFLSLSFLDVSSEIEQLERLSEQLSD